MSTFDYVNEWFKQNEELVNQTVTDKNHILTSKYGHKKGAYLVSVELTDKNILIPMYAGEAGADDDHDRSIADRLKEHLRHWLGTYTTYYTGVRKKDLLDGKMKFCLEIVGEAEKKEDRKQLETTTILTKKPYLQYGPYKKYDSDYDGIDLCIVPFKGTRRKAFLNALKEKGIEIEEGERLIDRTLDKSFRPDWKACAQPKEENEAIAEKLRQEMEYWTEEEYRDVKKVVDTGLGCPEGSRGCMRKYLIRVLSHALA
ncbi:MAG: hypothetical protein IKO10_12350 [Lachnospiraceae bacterium]|nr:hypothetical protein [Lachnospiraceae bacterium]